jgi:DNA primase
MLSDELGEILDMLDIESWLDREGITYKRERGSRGPQANVKECPCCGNSNWKVYIGLETGFGNCFSGDCEKKFNKFTFIKSFFGHMSTREVIEHIKQAAKEQGWRPPKRIAVATNLNTELVLPDSFALPRDGRNLKYLINRNIDSSVARYFGLRFSKKGWFNYRDEDGKDRHQSYANRIIIPIFDLEGELVSFQGRDITGDAEKKYLFPPGFASTGSVIYNGQNALGAEHVVIGEGVFDVMATKIALDGQMELRDIVPVGSFGKSLSFGDDSSQVAKLMQLKERGLKTVTFMWDAEPKALEAAAEAALKLKGYGFNTRVAVLPVGKDPNEVAAPAVRDAYWKAMSVNAMTMTKLKMMASKMS